MRSIIVSGVQSRRSNESPRLAQALCVALAVACLAVVLGAPSSILDARTISWPAHPLERTLDRILGLRWTLALLVSAPLGLSAIIASKLVNPVQRGRRAFVLELGSYPFERAAPGHQGDQPRWAHIGQAVKVTWDYEKDRVLRSLRRVPLQSLMFGVVATFALTCCVLALNAPSPVFVRGAYAVIAAVATAFLANLVRVTVRISGDDVTGKTLAWATRSLVLVTIAEVGLFVVLKDVVTNDASAVLLGVFVGATGDHAIQFLLEKGAAALKVATPASVGPSPLLDIDGMTAAHVERLEEEGVVSVHDLAFVPTARLFFSTAYSLQQICNWQDAALLLVYVGKDAAKALADKMEIRGAIDLRSVAHDVLFGPAEDEPERNHIKESLQKALGLDEGGTLALLHSMAHDEVTMRVRMYWSSAVAPGSLERRPSAVAPGKPGPQDVAVNGAEAGLPP